MLYLETQQLLEQYSEYKKTNEALAKQSRLLAVAKLTNKPYESLQAEHESLSASLQALSDAMTFASPLIWIQYKYEAYKDEAQPIRTMHDFRVHCSKLGYICTKRFEFLNSELVRANRAPLSDITAYPDGMELSEVLESAHLQKCGSAADFQERWDNYEYYKQGGRVAKWENWQAA